MMKPCLTCGRPSPGTRCPEHTAQHSQPRNARRHRKQKAHGRNTAHYRRTRIQVLERDGYRCARCNGPANSVHLTPAMEGRHDIALAHHYLSLCLSCHGSIDAPRSHPQR